MFYFENNCKSQGISCIKAIKWSLVIAGILVFVLFIIGSENAEADTSIPAGNVNNAIYPGGWTSSGSPYWIEGNITVPNSVSPPGDPSNTLTIDGSSGPVVIKFNGSYSLRVGESGSGNPASLKVTGNSKNILFTRNESWVTSWEGIQYTDSAASPSEFDNATVEHVKAKVGCGVMLNGTSSMKITNCEVRYVTGFEEAIGIGLFNRRGIPTDNNVVERNLVYSISVSNANNASAYGIYIVRGLANTISNNMIKDISVTGGEGKGLAAGIYLINSSFTILDQNDISNIICDRDEVLGIGLMDDSDWNDIINSKIANITAQFPGFGDAFGIGFFGITLGHSTDYNDIFNTSIDNIYSHNSSSYGISIQYKATRNSISDNMITNIKSGFDGVNASGIDLFNNIDILIANNTFVNITSDSQNSSFGLKFKDSEGYLIANTSFYMISSNGSAYGIYNLNSTDTHFFNLIFNNITGASSAIGSYSQMTDNITYEQIILRNITGLSSSAMGFLDYSTINMTFHNLMVSKIYAGSGFSIAIHAVSSNHSYFQDILIEDVLSTNTGAFGLTGWYSNNMSCNYVTIHNITANGDSAIGVNLMQTSDVVLDSMDIMDIKNLGSGDAFGLRSKLGSKNMMFTNSSISNVTTAFSGAEAHGVYAIEPHYDVIFNLEITNIQSTNGLCSGIMLDDSVGVTIEDSLIGNITGKSDYIAGIHLGDKYECKGTWIYTTTITNIMNTGVRMGIYAGEKANDTSISGNVIHSLDYGIYVTNNTIIRIGNSTIYDNQFGIWANNNSFVNLYNNEIYDNFVWGLWSDSTTYGDWIVDAPASFMNNDGFLYGDLTVWSTGNLIFRNTTFSIHNVSSNGTIQVQQAKNTIISWNLTVDGPFTLDNSIWEINNTFDGEHWISVGSNGNLMVVNNSQITAYDTNYRYDFWVNGSATFKDSIVEYAGYSYTQGSFGVHVSSDSVSFNNMMIRYCRIGIFVNASSPNIGNTTIHNCSISVALINGDTVGIQNISIWNITPPIGTLGAGIFVENYDNVSLFEINVDGPYANAGGIMFVGSQGGLVSDSILRDIDIGLDVNASNVTVTNTEVYGNQNGIRVYLGANLTALDCNVSDNIESGFIFEDSAGLLDKCTVSTNGMQGVFVINSSPIIESCSIFHGNQDYGIYCEDNASPLVVNSTISSGVWDFIMDTNSHPVSLNSSFDEAKVTFLDAQSSLTVKWFLHIRVEGSLGQGIPFTYVRVKDNENGTYDSLFITDSQGYVNWIVVTEYTEDTSIRTDFTPHILRAWNSTLFGKRSQKIDSSMLVIITLDTPSEVVVGKMADNVTVGVNEYITYTLWYYNTISENITHVYVNDTLNLNLNYISDTSGIAPYIIVNTYSWYLGNVTPGNHSFQLLVKTKGGIANGAIVDNEFKLEYSDRYFVPMLIISSNKVSCEILAPEMSIEKSVENLTMDLGKVNTYTIWYNNTGGKAAKVLWINDTLHTNLTIVTSSAENNRTGISWQFFDVGPGVHFITVVVKLDSWTGLAGLEIENQATLEYLDYGSVSGPPHISNYANFTVLFPPEVDFIRIEYLAGGLVAEGTIITADDNLVLFARGYNETKGLIGDVIVNWGVNGGIGTLNVSMGTTITFDATIVGLGSIFVTSVDGTNVTGSITVLTGVAADIKIVPAGPATYNADETRNYRVYGYDADGNLNTSWVAQWSWDGANLGVLTQITPDGYNYSVEFHTVGLSLIRVSVSGNPSVFNTSSVTVLAGKVVEIIISPGGGETNTTDDVLNFTVLGFDADGNLNDTWIPSVYWSGPVLGIISKNGYSIEVEFTDVGTSIINVSDASNSKVYNDTKSVLVNLGSPYRLVYISGRNQFGFPNAQLMSPFIVRVEDYDGNYIPNIMINWSLDAWPSGASNQSLSAYNSMTNSFGEANTTLTLGDKDGVYYVNATSLTLILVGEPVTFYATVSEFTTDEIMITDILQKPMGDIDLSADDTITLYAWSYNKTGGILGSIAVNWSSSGGIGVFTTSWILQPQVTFDLTTVGKGDITAQFSNATLFLSNITGTITVRCGVLASIVVTPSTVTQTTDGFNFYYAVGYDGDSNKNWSWSPLWEWEGPGLGNLAEIDIYNYSVDYDTVGVDVIKVSSVSNPSIYDTVSITILSGQVVRIEITPWPSISATTDENQGFSVTGYDADSNQNWSWNPQWQWNGPNLGIMTPIDAYNYSVEYNRVGSSQIRVSSASNPTVFNFTTVTVTLGELVEIIITPGGSQTNTTDDVLNFTVSGYDSDGNLNDTWTPIISWTGDNLGIITLKGYDVKVEFTVVGMSTINVSASEDSTIYNNTKGVTVNPGSPYQLIYVSGRDQVEFPNTKLMFPFVVKVEDFDGNPVPGVLINWSLDGWPSGAGNQSLSGYNTVTNSEGMAETTLTLGNKQGVYYVNATSLTLVLLGEPVTFSATVSIYTIDGIVITDYQKKLVGDIELSTDDTIILYAWTYNETGGILGSIAVNWSATGGIGVFTTPTISRPWVSFDLTTLGQGDITALFTNATVTLSDTTGKIDVRLGVLAHILLAPSSVSNTADGSDIFMVIGYDSDVNLNWSWTPQWNWEGSGLGPLTPIDAYNYSVDYDTVGYDFIRVSSASNPDIYDTAMVSIISGVVVRIEISPWPSTSSTTDDAQEFKAIAYDSDGNENWTWNSQWEWIGPSLGPLTQIDAYNYSAEYNIVGSSQIRVMVSGNPSLFNITLVSVRLGVLASIVLTPSSVTNTADGFDIYKAVGYDADGNQNWSWTPQWNWEGPGLGTLTQLDQYNYSADYAIVGSDVIRVTSVSNPTLYARAMVSIKPGQVARLEISPWPSTSATTDDARIFRVKGYDAEGNVNWTWVSQWEWIGLGLGTLTPIDAYNYSVDYKTVGSDQIRVSVSGNPSILNTTSVTVTVGKVAKIIITPGGPEINTTDDVLNFTVSGYDSDGNLNSIWTPLVSWTGPNLGIITVNGYNVKIEFTKVGASIINISNSADSKIYNNTKSVTVSAGSPYRIVYVSGGYQFGFPNSTLQSPFYVKVQDYDGNPVTNVMINWSLDGWPLGANNQYLSSYNSLTNSQGIANTTLTLGDRPGRYYVNATSLTLDLVGEPVTFSATVTLHSIDGIVITDENGLYFGDIELSTDDTITIYAMAFNTTEGVLGSVAANWSASGSIGIFTTSQIMQTQITFELTTVGRGDITAQFSNATLLFSNTTGKIKVRPGILTSIVLTPSSVTDTTDGFDLFKTVGYDADSNQNWSWTPLWNWESLGLGSFTFIDQFNLSVDYNKVGADYLRVSLASNPTIYSRSQVTILPGQVVRIELSPWPSTSGTADETQDFFAIGYDSDGNVNWNWVPQWYWVGPGLGVLTPIDDYNYSVDYDTVGKDNLGVRVSGNPSIYNSTEIQVTAGQIVCINISPWPTVSATTDDTQIFKVVGYDSDNNENWLWTPIWGWVGSGLGTLILIDNYNCSVDYDTVGSDAINVILSGNPGIYNRTSIFVSVGDVVRIEISPWPSILVTTDDMDTIRVIGYDLDGNKNWVWVPQWDWVGLGLGILTPIDDFNYSVDYDTVGNDEINVMVSGDPLTYNRTYIQVTTGQVAKIVISPWPSTFNYTGDTGYFSVIGYDADGNENWTWVPQWSWEATGLGTLSPISPYNYTILFIFPGSDAINVSLTGNPNIFNTTSLIVENPPPPPTVDYIVIRTAPSGGGIVVGDLIYCVGDTDIFYAAGFNLTTGFVKDIEVLWGTSDENNGTVIAGPGFSTTFSANLTHGGKVIISATNYSIPQTSSYTGLLTVLNPAVDYIKIRDSPNGGGSEVGARNYTVGETDIFYAAGYNYTAGYIGDVPVNWQSMVAIVGDISPSTGSSTTTFATKAIGQTRVSAVYKPGDPKLTPTTGLLTVSPVQYTVDFIMIRNASGGAGGPVISLILGVGDDMTFYAAGYNSTTGSFVMDVPVSWNITTGIGTIDALSGPSTKLTTLDSMGSKVSGNLTATYEGMTSSTFIIMDLRPASPQGLTVSKRPEGKSLLLSWSASDESDVIGYNIYRSDPLYGGFSRIYTILGRDNTTYVDTGLVDGQTYEYYLIAFDSFPNYSGSSIQASGTPDTDTDLDGLYNSEDDDDDNDGLSDSEEIKIGTNPLLADTDGDGHIDSEDDYPLNIAKWKKEEESPIMFFLLPVIVILIILIIVAVVLRKRGKSRKEIPYERRPLEEVSMEDMKALDKELELEEAREEESYEEGVGEQVPQEEYYEEGAGEEIPQEEYYEEGAVQKEQIEEPPEEVEAPDVLDTALMEVERSLKALEGSPSEPLEESGEQKVEYASKTTEQEIYYEDEEEMLPDEEFECPMCRYPVSITMNKCPNCGVEFENEE